MKQLHKWVCRLSEWSGVFAAGLMVVSVLVVCHMIFVRAVLGDSSIWQTEFVTYALVAATFLGAPYILLTRGHVNVDLLPMFLGDRQRRALAWLASILSFVFCLLFLYSAAHWWWEACRFPCASIDSKFPIRQDHTTPSPPPIYERHV